MIGPAPAPRQRRVRPRGIPRRRSSWLPLFHGAAFVLIGIALTAVVHLAVREIAWRMGLLIGLVIAAGFASGLIFAVTPATGERFSSGIVIGGSLLAVAGMASYLWAAPSAAGRLVPRCRSGRRNGVAAHPPTAESGRPPLPRRLPARRTRLAFAGLFTGLGPCACDQSPRSCSSRSLLPATTARCPARAAVHRRCSSRSTQDLRMLGHYKRVLVIGAHPDDEDTELLTMLVRVAGRRGGLSLAQPGRGRPEPDRIGAGRGAGPPPHRRAAGRAAARRCAAVLHPGLRLRLLQDARRYLGRTGPGTRSSRTWCASSAGSGPRSSCRSSAARRVMATASTRRRAGRRRRPSAWPGTPALSRAAAAKRAGALGAAQALPQRPVRHAPPRP